MNPAVQNIGDPAVASVLARSRAVLENHYGARLAGLVLYGSTARGTAGAESDLDILVLLHGDFDFFRELRTITALLYGVQLDSNRRISARPAAVADFEAGVLQLYRNAAIDGLRV